MMEGVSAAFPRSGGSEGVDPPPRRTPHPRSRRPPSSCGGANQSRALQGGENHHVSGALRQLQHNFEKLQREKAAMEEYCEEMEQDVQSREVGGRPLLHPTSSTQPLLTGGKR